MIEGNRVEVYPSDSFVKKTNIGVFVKELSVSGSHDNGFRLINSENHLNVSFADVTNLSIDFAYAGFLSFVISTPWLLMAIPEKVGIYQLARLDSVMSLINDNVLVIYDITDLNWSLNSGIKGFTPIFTCSLVIDIFKKLCLFTPFPPL